MTTVSPAVGDVAVMRLPISGYGACQVAGTDGNGVTAYALAWESADIPALPQLAGVPPLTLDHHAHPRGPARIGIAGDQLPPPGWRWLGNLPVPAAMSGEINSYSSWSWLTIQITEQRRWDRYLPAAAKEAYRRGATRGQVDIDLGLGPVTLGAATGHLDLTGAGPLSPPPTGPVRWAALGLLARCTSLTWTGPDRGLVAALTDHPIVHDLTWTDAPRHLDLRGTGLTSLSVRGTIDLLQLPDHLTALHLMAGARIGTVSAAGDGRWLRMTVIDPGPGERLPAGLGQVRDLRQVGRGTISAAPLSELRQLEELWLSWRGGPGELDDAAALGELTRLAHLTMNDAYGIDAGTLPELPALSALTVHGLRRTVAAALKARYRGTGVRVDVTGAKNDTWLAANLTNPFRDWADDDPRGGAAACKAYAAAVRSVDALAKQAPDHGGGAEAVLRRLVEQLNRIDARYRIIDTVRREEAGDAFAGLAVRAGVSDGQADDWFDEWRDF
ncbi:hypothetical protein [Actinoplanes sp. NPDC020271]|uniref:hypothetical protein n=1 Tax=Actinoplanes sp. NPDC020271 TaxID=3363896 RepID=UPI0037BA4CD6